MKTRCKFYVTATKSQQGSRYVGKNDKGIDSWESCLTTEVCFNAAYSSDPKSENYAFWKSSPSGKLEISGPADEMAKFVPGSFWYIDETPISKGANDLNPDALQERLAQPDVWRLSLMEKPHSGQLRVQLRQAKGPGLFEVSIDNESAWANYTNLDDLYLMEILPAEK